MEERLKILKNIRDKHVTVMNNNLEIYGAFQHRTTFRQVFLHLWSRLTGESVGPYKNVQNLGFENVNGRFITETFLLVLQGFKN